MRILFVHNALRSFVRIDRDILSERHVVDEMDLSVPARILTLPPRLLQADLVFSWFASLHSFFPVMAAAALRKPAVSVVGAYDAANVPEINFGHMGHPWKRHIVRRICNASTLLICNSEYAVATVRANVRTRTPVRRIYHGVDCPEALLTAPREPIVLSVGQIRAVNLKRKGHGVFARASALVPEARFILVGEIMDDSDRYLRAIGGPNFEVRDHLPQSELEALYAQASVYVQPSAHESFGLSVVEAMAWGEVPVVSSKGSLPEVVGQHGLIVDEHDPESVAGGIRRALVSSEDQRQAAAAFVRDRFPLARRRQALLDAVEEACGDKSALPAAGVRQK